MVSLCEWVGMMSPDGDSLVMMPNWLLVSSPDSSTLNRSVNSIECSPSPLRRTYGTGLAGQHTLPLRAVLRVDQEFEAHRFSRGEVVGGDGLIMGEKRAPTHPACH